MLENIDKLNNPAWFSLLETHKHLSIQYDNISFYLPAYCPFGAFESTQNISAEMEAYSLLTEDFYLIGANPPIPEKLQLIRQLECNQMIINKDPKVDLKEKIVKISPEYAGELYALVNYVQPGYFKSKTFLLGDYFGIFKNNKLIAVAGERMQMNNFIEVSAVVTHPKFSGRGYAKQLVAHVVRQIQLKNKTPYLHVAATNSVAINLYEKIGFTTRTKINFWQFKKI